MSFLIVQFPGFFLHSEMSPFVLVLILPVVFGEIKHELLGAKKLKFTDTENGCVLVLSLPSDRWC